MSKLENLISEHRINSAVRKAVPRDKTKEVSTYMVRIFCPYPTFGQETERNYSHYNWNLHKDREDLKEIIEEVHPEWRKKAPKKSVIIYFLSGSPT